MHLILLSALQACAARTPSSPGYIPPGTKFAGKLPLQKSISTRVCYVCPKVIAERDMPVVFATARRAHIQVMLNIGSVLFECAKGSKGIGELAITGGRHCQCGLSRPYGRGRVAESASEDWIALNRG